MLVIAAVLISVLVTAVLVVVVLRMLGGSSVAEARREAETIRREAKIEAREEAVRLRQEVEREVAEQRGRITKIEERVLAREDEIERRQRDVERREQGLSDREVHVKELQEDLKEAKQRELEELERVAGMTVNEAKTRLLAQSEELVRHDLARRVRQLDEEAQAEAKRRATESRRRRAAARRREPCLRDHVLADRAPVRRHERPDHRPRGTEHPHARAPDRGGRDRRRHASGGRALVLRPDPPRDREDDAPQARRGRPHPAGADRGDVLPVQGRDRRAHPPGRRAGRLRGERGRVPRGGRQAPRPAQLPHELRPERPQAHARGRPPRPG